jgi:1,4-dihydroxy-2-naphthoate octaprenyltransferase
MPSLKALAGVARVPFLLLPVTLVASGAAAAAYDGHFHWLHTVVALIGLVALHVAVNVLNEWSDMRTGIDLQTRRTPFSGGSGTLPAGAISLRGTLVFGLLAAAVGLAVGVWFLTRVGWVLLPIMVLGAVCVLAYTDVLARLGVGEVAAGFGLGGLPVVGAALVQDGTIGAAAVAAGIPATFMTFNLLLLNEFPDEAADRAGGRRHLVIRLGRPAAARIFAAAVLLTPLSIAAGVAWGALPPISLAAMLPSLLVGKAVQWAVQRPAEPVPIPALGGNVMWNLGTNTVLALSLVAALLL